MNITTIALTAAATLGITAAVLPTTTPASAGSPATDPTQLTFRLAARDAETKHIDIGRKGDSIGDHYIAAMTLRADGAIAGRLQNDCVVLDNAYEGHLCSLVLIIKGGQVTLASGGVNKRIPNVGGRGEAFAVTGGTGDYQGVGGELTFGDDGRTMRLALVR
jgi:hypothetical protein